MSIFRFCEIFHYKGFLRLFHCLNKIDGSQTDCPIAIERLCFAYRAPYSFHPCKQCVYAQRCGVKQVIS